jgi:hypothetical protein
VPRRRGPLLPEEAQQCGIYAQVVASFAHGLERRRWGCHAGAGSTVRAEEQVLGRVCALDELDHVDLVAIRIEDLDA